MPDPVLDRRAASVSESGSRAASPGRALTLATISFAICFAAWGLIGGLASVFADLYAPDCFTDGAARRRPGAARLAGALADGHAHRSLRRARWSSRCCSASRPLAALLVPLTGELRVTARGRVLSRYGRLVVLGRRRLRVALDAAGPAGHGARRLRAGHARTVAGRVRRPGRRGRFGWEAVFRGIGRPAPGVGRRLLPARAQSPAARRVPPASARWSPSSGAQPTAWLLGAFYFLTFGGFVAFSIYLPTLLRAQFGLAPADAGFRAAGFVVLATLMRPVGGWLADRIGGAQVLSWVFGGVAAVRAAADVAVDGAVHGRRARVRDADGTGQRRGLQARARAFPEGHRHGHRAWSARSADWAGSFRRCCWASSAISSACIWPGFLLLSATALALRFGESAGVPSGRRRVDASRLPTAARQALERVRAGAWATLVDGGAGGRHRRRLAQPAALRRRARRLHLRDAVCGVRDQLPLRDVAEAAADAHVLAARLAGVLLAPRRLGRNVASVSAAARSLEFAAQPLTSSGAAGCAGSRTG